MLRSLAIFGLFLIQQGFFCGIGTGISTWCFLSPALGLPIIKVSVFECQKSYFPNIVVNINITSPAICFIATHQEQKYFISENFSLNSLEDGKMQLIAGPLFLSIIGVRIAIETTFQESLGKQLDAVRQVCAMQQFFTCTLWRCSISASKSILISSLSP